ncbi:MAG: hypothetical protein SV422_02780 [Pseudomonadota bacterium]|nr:hypothetical protein [Pseudomonadota bacterium]
MAWFLFAGDMLVMLFMTVLVVWLSLRGKASANDFSAHIPLHDDTPERERARGGEHHG